eukprot:gene7326-8108_t
MTQSAAVQATGTKLYEIIKGLRHFGVGVAVTRSIYRHPNTYWIITSVRIPAGKTHGKIYGRLVWNGVPKGKNEELRCPLKKEWSLVSFPDYKTFNGDASVLLPRAA